ncbi:30S ribosomal protein S2p (SAe) [Candidatus Nasuia deltocephalinicola]|nr:30S ribosomal protein S2p (SAe) [Candidatus Nasuia deltocephalinicola]
MSNLINEMLINCVHLGHKSNLMNKLMKPYIVDIKSELSIINLEKTNSSFIKVLNIIKKLTIMNKIILIVCNKKYTKNLIKIASKSVNLPYVNKRWLGGTLTNFESFKNSVNRIEYLKSIIKMRKKIGIKKRYIYMYLKKIKSSRKLIIGIEKLKKIPDFIFIIDSKQNKNLILEAKKINIPVACVVDSDSSPLNIDFVIPGNDDSIKSISFYIRKIIEVIKKSRELVVLKKKNENR